MNCSFTHVAAVWRRRVTQCAKRTGSAARVVERVSGPLITAKARAQRKRTRFDLVKPVTTANLAEMAKPDIAEEATSTCTR